MNPVARVLVVDDDDHLREGLVTNLQLEGYVTVEAADGRVGFEQASSGKFQLILLDLNLPHLDGMDLCRLLREKGDRVPILMLTARGQQEDRVAGLETGADDYLVKPFSLEELMARVRALLRRRDWDRHGEPSLLEAALPSESHFGSHEVYWDRMEVKTPGATIHLTQQEAKLLRFFLVNPNRVFSRQEILQRVWGYGPHSQSRTVDAFITRFRKYFEEEPSSPKFFLTERGSGYRFQLED